MSNRPNRAADSKREFLTHLSREDSDSRVSRVELPGAVTLSTSPTTFPTHSEILRPFRSQDRHTHETSAGLPPLPKVDDIRSGHTTRLAGVSSILNPISSPPSSKLDTLPSLESNTTNSDPRSTVHVSTRSLHDGGARVSAEHPNEAGLDIETRPILAPRSPITVLHRALSHGQINTTHGVRSSHHASHPTSPHGGPAHPELRSFAGSWPFPNQREGSEVLNRANYGANRVADGTPMISTPSTPFPKYDQMRTMSPNIHAASSTNAIGLGQRLGPSHYADTTSSYGLEAGEARQHAVGIPISSSGGQNAYQMMTLETASGRVHLPVDVQAASRVADEKRRRNAGASARFRQRRKEKEKEASSSISKLQQQVKDLREQAEHYKSERDYLAGIVNRIPGHERYAPRQPSPRRRRTPSTGASSSASVYATSLENAPRVSEDGRGRAPIHAQTAPYTGLPTGNHGQGSMFGSDNARHNMASYAPGHPYESRRSPQSDGQSLPSLHHAGDFRNVQGTNHHIGPTASTAYAPTYPQGHQPAWTPSFSDRLPPFAEATTWREQARHGDSLREQ